MGKAAPVIVTVVAVVATVYAGPAVGAAILEGMGVAGASAATTAAVGGAAISGATGAVNAAIQGKDVNGILEAGAKGTAAGAVAGGAAGAAGGGVAGGVAGGAAGGATSAQLSGKNLDTTLKQAAIGGAAGGITAGATQLLTPGAPAGEAPGAEFDYAGGDRPVFDPVTGQELTPQQVAAQNPNLYPGGVLPAMGQETVYSPTGEVTYQAATDIPQRPGLEERLAGRAAGTLASRALIDYFYPQTSTVGGYGFAPRDVTTGDSSTGGYTGVGSSALGQALRIGDAGAPIESPSGEKKETRPVWNIASLRVKDETGSE